MLRADRRNATGAVLVSQCGVVIGKYRGMLVIGRDRCIDAARPQRRAADRHCAGSHRCLIVGQLGKPHPRPLPAPH